MAGLRKPTKRTTQRRRIRETKGGRQVVVLEEKTFLEKLFPRLPKPTARKKKGRRR